MRRDSFGNALLSNCRFRAKHCLFVSFHCSQTCDRSSQLGALSLRQHWKSPNPAEVRGLKLTEPDFDSRTKRQKTIVQHVRAHLAHFSHDLSHYITEADELGMEFSLLRMEITLVEIHHNFNQRITQNWWMHHSWDFGPCLMLAAATDQMQWTLHPLPLQPILDYETFVLESVELVGLASSNLQNIARQMGKIFPATAIGFI